MAVRMSVLPDLVAMFIGDHTEENFPLYEVAISEAKKLGLFKPESFAAIKAMKIKWTGIQVCCYLRFPLFLRILFC